MIYEFAMDTGGWVYTSRAGESKMEISGL